MRRNRTEPLGASVVTPDVCSEKVGRAAGRSWRPLMFYGLISTLTCPGGLRVLTVTDTGEPSKAAPTTFDTLLT